NMDEDEEMPEDYELSFLEFINPEIISSEGEVMAYEGCLSFPGHNGAIVRPEKVMVRAFDRFGKPFTLEAKDMLARCICHETNHLDGVT
ncbi:MAG: peptide deformylase, partial [Oscillospiraceae bacterium]